MRRSIAFCEWMARWWRDQVAKRMGLNEALAEGIRAYAMEHAEDEQQRAAKWTGMWAAIRARAAITLQNKVGDVTEVAGLEEIEIALGEEGDDEDQDDEEED